MRPRLAGSHKAGRYPPLLANIVLDPLDKTLVTRGHMFARYADDFIVMVASAKAAQRVIKSLIGYVEGSLKLVVNQAKSRTAPLRQCVFLGFQVGANGKVVWSDKAKKRFKLRIRQITSRNRGCHVRDVIDELRRYVTGWINYFGISHTYKSVLELDKWLRRRVRLYYWKQWFRGHRPTRPGAQRTGTTTTDATPPLDRPGYITRGGQNGVAQPKGLLANEQ